MAIFGRGPQKGASNAGWVLKNRDFRPIFRFISEMIGIYLLWNANRNSYPWNGAISNDLEWSLTQTSRSCHHMPHSLVSFWMTLSDLDWLSKIFIDTKHRGLSATAELLANYADILITIPIYSFRGEVFERYAKLYRYLIVCTWQLTGSGTLQSL